MMKMLRYEIKKCFSKTANKIGLLILTVVLIIVSYFAVTYVDYVDEDGNNRTGIIAVRSLRDMKINGQVILRKMYLEK